jgi:hypothetical protein
VVLRGQAIWWGGLAARRRRRDLRAAIRRTMDLFSSSSSSNARFSSHSFLLSNTIRQEIEKSADVCHEYYKKKKKIFLV